MNKYVGTTYIILSPPTPQNLPTFFLNAEAFKVKHHGVFKKDRVLLKKHHRLFSGVGCARKFWNYIHRFGVVVEGVRRTV